MIIGGIFILRIFLHKVLMNAKQSLGVEEKLATSEYCFFPYILFVRKLMNIGSFLYNIAIDSLQESAPIDSKNQSFLPYDLKIKPRGIPLRANGT
jgi:hypothetical protein